MKKSGSSNQLLDIDEDEFERDRDRDVGRNPRNRSGSPVSSRARAGSASPTRNTSKTLFAGHLSSSASKPEIVLRKGRHSFSHIVHTDDEPSLQSDSGGVRLSPASSIIRKSPVASPTGLTTSIESPLSRSESSSVTSISEGTERRSRPRRTNSAKSCVGAPKSLAETLKAAIEEGMPLPKPLSSLLFHSVSIEHLLQLLVALLLLSSALLPCELPIADCVVMAVMHSIAIILELVFAIHLKKFNFTSAHINVPALLRDAETLSDEVRNVHLNKSISTIAVQREEGGVTRFERNMAAVVPVNSIVRFHPKETMLPVGISENDVSKSSSGRWSYASVTQNLAVDCLKRLLQRPRSSPRDPLTQIVQRALNRVSWAVAVVASVVLFAFVRAPVSDLSLAFRSLAVLLMPLLPSMILFSISLSVAVMNAAISSHSSLPPSSAPEASGRKGSLTYARLEESTGESVGSPASLCCNSVFLKVKAYFRQLLQVRLLPAVSDDNQNPVELSILSIISWLFKGWKHMFHDFNYMHMMSRITVLCVLDKEGILAQPQPEAKDVMCSRSITAGASASHTQVLARTLSRRVSGGAADVADVPFVTVPINQEDDGKCVFRYENELEKSRSFEILKQIAVCSQLTATGLNIDEDAPKPANSCVKGLQDLCNVINEQYDDKNVPVQDKQPIWKKYVEQLLPNISIAFVQRRAPDQKMLDVSMSGGVQRVLHDTTVSNTIKREFQFQQYAVYTVGRPPQDQHSLIQVYFRGAPEMVLESCTSLMQHADSPFKALTEDDKAVMFEQVNRWRILDMSVEALAVCYVHISDAPELFDKLLKLAKHMRSGKTPTVSCDSTKEDGAETISSCSQCKHKNALAPCEYCDLARVLFRDLKDSTLLGLVSFANRPVPSVAPVLKALNKSGIRFSWFGSSCEPAVLDFGKNLGLETDWNCCLSLQDLPEGVSSRLPAGITAIQKHVEGNDDVPLRVPMFCDAAPSSVQSMIRMYQDNGEVVAVVGSSLKVENMAAFLAADLAFSLRPRVALLPSKAALFHKQNNVLLAGKLISTPCTLTSDFSSEYFSSALIQKILIARLIYTNSHQAVLFTAHAAALLVLSQFLCCVLRMPALISAGQMGFITLFLVPALSAACLLSPDHASFPVVKRIPDKQNDEDSGTLMRKRHLSYYSVALILPSAFLIFMIQVVSLHDLRSTNISDVFAHPVFSPAQIEETQVQQSRASGLRCTRARFQRSHLKIFLTQRAFQLTVLIWLVLFLHVAAVAFLHRRVAPTALHLLGASVPPSIECFAALTLAFRQPVVHRDVLHHVCLFPRGRAVLLVASQLSGAAG